MKTALKLAILGVCLWAPARAEEPAGAAEIPIVADMPYNRDQMRNFVRVTNAMKEGAFPFAVHVGDYKGGGADCTAEIDALFKAWLTGFENMPVFYTPGDNEWTDCDRAFLKAPVSERERLATVRKLMFSEEPKAPEEWGLTYQESLPENAQWSYGGAVYATLHVTGTNNGRAQILKDDKALALADVEARDAANLDWVRSAFARAKAQKASAVLLFQQADPTDARFKVPCSASKKQDCDGFAALREEMRRLAGDFGGPVLLVHGDTAPYCVDKSFGGKDAPRFWRLNAAGDFLLIDALKLTIDLKNKSAPFSVQSLVYRVPPADGC